MRLIPGLRPPTVRSSNPVDAQHLARDERAQRTCEHFDDARDFVHGGDAVQRACFRHSFLIHRARVPMNRPVRVSPGAMQFTVMS